MGEGAWGGGGGESLARKARTIYNDQYVGENGVNNQIK